jgi:hypothetical protein
LVEEDSNDNELYKAEQMQVPELVGMWALEHVKTKQLND